MISAFQAFWLALLAFIFAAVVFAALLDRRCLTRIKRLPRMQSAQSAPPAPDPAIPLFQAISFHAAVLAYHQNRYVIDHVKALAGNDAAAPPAISYRFASLARLIEPRMENGTAASTVCTVAVGEDYQKIVAPCIDSHRRFALRHGLGYAILETPPAMFDRPAPWLKLPLLLHLMDKGAERILFVDADAMITNPDIAIDDKFDRLQRSQKLFLMTEDEAGLNTGVIFVRNHPVTKRMLDLIWLFDADVHHGHWEQFAIKTVMSTLPEFPRYIDIDPRPKNFNSFPAERNLFHRTLAPQVWSEDDFICHFAGIRGAELHRYIRDYDNAVTRERQRRSAAATAVVG